jgi:hypothetical protein
VVFAIILIIGFEALGYHRYLCSYSKPQPLVIKNLNALHMKKLLIALLLPFVALAQQPDSLQLTDKQETRIFSFTPVADYVGKVNGFTFGVGLALNLHEPKPVVVNGFNLEINPLTPLVVMFLDPSRVGNDTLAATVNGLHIAAGGFFANSKINGLGITVFNVGHQSNGMTVNGLYNVSKVMNGLHISGLSNSAETAGCGLFIAPFNYAGRFGGMQLGGFNHAGKLTGFSLGLANVSQEEMTGVQVGLFNRTKKCRGLQIGLWNINNKRSLPFINW